MKEKMAVVLLLVVTNDREQGRFGWITLFLSHIWFRLSINSQPQHYSWLLDFCLQCKEVWKNVSYLIAVYGKEKEAEGFDLEMILWNLKDSSVYIMKLLLEEDSTGSFWGPEKM